MELYESEDKETNKKKNTITRKLIIDNNIISDIQYRKFGFVLKPKSNTNTNDKKSQTYPHKYLMSHCKKRYELPKPTTGVKKKLVVKPDSSSDSSSDSDSNITPTKVVIKSKVKPKVKPVVDSEFDIPVVKKVIAKPKTSVVKKVIVKKI